MNKNPRGRKPLTQVDLEKGRAKILEAARALFVEQGYRSVSMRALARAINMSPTSIYRFFPNRRAILINLWTDIFNRLFQDCRIAARKADTPQNALINYANCFVEYWVSHPESYIMVYGEIDTPEKGESFFADSELVAEELSFLTDLLASIGAKAQDIELTLQQLLCIMHGTCHSLITIPELNWQSASSITKGLVEKLLNRGGGL